MAYKHSYSSIYAKAPRKRRHDAKTFATDHLGRWSARDSVIVPLPPSPKRSPGRPKLVRSVKMCPDCCGDYPITTEHWCRNKSANDGFDSLCKACRSKRSKLQYDRKWKHWIWRDTERQWYRVKLGLAASMGIPSDQIVSGPMPEAPPEWAKSESNGMIEAPIYRPHSGAKDDCHD